MRLLYFIITLTCFFVNKKETNINMQRKELSTLLNSIFMYIDE